MILRIEAKQLGPSSQHREAPVHRGLPVAPPSLPGLDGGLQGGDIRHPLIEALTRQHGESDLVSLPMKKWRSRAFDTTDEVGEWWRRAPRGEKNGELIVSVALSPTSQESPHVSPT